MSIEWRKETIGKWVLGSASAMQKQIPGMKFRLLDDGLSFIWRIPPEGEATMARDPALDGITDKIKTRGTPKHLGRPPKYPWEKWTDGNWHIAFGGRDFDISLDSFRITLHTRARNKDMSVQTTRVKIKAGFAALYGVPKGCDALAFCFYVQGEGTPLEDLSAYHVIDQDSREAQMAWDQEMDEENGTW